MRNYTRILTSEGKIVELCTGNVELMHREVMLINGKEVEIYFKNVGKGEDTNTILVDEEYEIGNLTPDRVQALMNKFLQEEAIDLTDIRAIHRTDEIVEGEEYLNIETWTWAKRTVNMQD